MILYHGTSTSKVDRIKKGGLIPLGSPGADYASRRVTTSWVNEDEDSAVYLITSKETALEFADLVAEDLKDETALITVRIPSDYRGHLEIDPRFYQSRNSYAYQYFGVIPPDWIVDIEIGLKPKRPMRILRVYEDDTQKIVDIRTGKEKVRAGV